MPLAVTCGSCKKKVRIPDTLVGKAVKCPGCASKLNTTAKPKSAENGTAKKPSPERAPVPAPKPAPAAKKGAPAAAASAKSAAPPKKPVGAAAKGKSTTTIKKAPPVEDPDDVDIAPAKPTAKPKFEPKPAPAPVNRPTPAPARPSKRPSEDDDEGGGASKLALFGGGFVVLFLVVLGVWWLFFSGEPAGTVSGVITMNSAPLEAADVIFVGDDDPKLGPFRGVTSAEGRYELFGSHGGGITPGKYKVLIEKWVMPDGKLPKDAAARAAAEEAAVLKNLIAPETGTRMDTTLRATVKNGSNTFDFEAKKSR